MPIKQENEITIRILCSKEELIKYLEEKGLKKGRRFRLDDHYLIPKILKLEELTVREILAKAVIIRNIEMNIIFVRQSFCENSIFLQGGVSI